MIFIQKITFPKKMLSVIVRFEYYNVITYFTDT